MKTTLDLDRKLLDRAKKVLGAASYTQAIELALREAVARADARDRWEHLIGSDLSWQSVEDLLAYRREYGGRAV
jgi:hypothetical protein